MYASHPAKLKLEDIQFDPEFRDLCPRLKDHELAQLEENIKAEGCRDALVVWGNVLVDGHHRCELCKKLGIEPRIVRIELPSREAAVAWIAANQVGKRNVTERWSNYLLGKRYLAERSTHGGPRASARSEHLGPTDKRIAQESRCSGAKVRRHAKVAAQLDRAEKAVPGIRAKILEREIRLPESAIVALADVPEDQLSAAVEALKNGVIPVVDPAPPVEMDARRLMDLRSGPMEEVDIEPIDLIVSEPPHATGVYRRLAGFAQRCLKPNGSFVVVVSPQHLPFAVAEIGSTLEYRWTLVCTGAATTTALRTKVRTHVKVGLWYGRGGYHGDPVGDVLEDSLEVSGGTQRLSVQGMSRIVSQFTFGGGLVCDPFLTNAAAAGTGRRFIGIAEDATALAAVRAQLGF